MKFKLTALEKQWILYDVGNSAFILLVSTIIPIYFNYLADNANISSVNYLAYWGYAASISTILVALIGPIAGTISDTRSYKKKFFILSIGVGIAGCIILGFLHSWIWFLGMFIITKVGYSSANIFYDSMLTDITVSERMDRVSSHGYAWGYIGSCIPFIASLGLVLGAGKLGLTMTQAMAMAFCIVAVWWLVSSLPLIKNYRQIHYVEKSGNAAKESFGRLFRTLKDMKRQKHIFMFLLAFFFYIDGVYTIIDMATAYGTSLGLDTTGLLLALLLTQIVAFPCVLIFARIAQKQDTTRLISICIAAYLGITLFAMQLDSQLEFWILAICVGMFQGTVQALSRSFFAKIIPPDKSGEYFGILDICGKGASFLGTTLVSIISQITGKVNLGVGALAIMFILGFVFFRRAVRLTKELQSSQSEPDTMTTTS